MTSARLRTRAIAESKARHARLAERATMEWSRYAGEPVRAEVIGGVLYAFGSELAVYRLHHKMRVGKVGYSRNLASWYFTTDKPILFDPSRRFPYSPTERSFRRLARSVSSSRPSRKEMIAALGLPPETRHRGMTGVAIGRYAASTAEFYNRIKHGSSRADIKARERLGIHKAAGDPALTPRRAEVIERSHAAFERERERFHPKKFKRGGGYTPEEYAEIARRAGIKKRPSNVAMGKLELHRFVTQRPERIFAYYKDDARVGATITTWMGDVLGHVIWRGTVTKRGFYPGARMVNIRMKAVTGDVYAGTCQLDSGNYCRLRKVKGG